jgi:hypothetical protein
MKWDVIFVALSMVFMLMLMNGCATKDMVYERAEPYLQGFGLDDDSTYLCADLWGQKVECPAGLLGHDFELWFLTLRVCFGFDDSNASVPYGMQCYVRNFVPDRNVTYLEATDADRQ